MTPPETIGGYRVVSLLGRGGMGTVYAVTDPRTGAVRALKVLGSGVAMDERLRFQREAQAMAAVDDHENVLRIHSAGMDGGRAFYVMDVAPGGDLAARLEAGPLPPAEVVRVGRAIARGLAHVHARGVLHRDLKPQNVLFDERDAPRLGDFGLAQVAGADRLTESGTVVGTPAYMSPEQARGIALDARSDVFSLGVLLYHAATGVSPFQRKSVPATLEAVVNDDPPPPSTRVPGLPLALDLAIRRALSKDPAARFSSAAELEAALEAHGPAPARRWPLLLAAAALAALALLALALAWPGAPPAPPRPPAAPPAAPAFSLDEASLLAWLDHDEASRGYAHLEAAWTAPVPAPRAQVLAWAAAFLVVAPDEGRADAWRGRAGADPDVGRWVVAVADLAQGQPAGTRQVAVRLDVFAEARKAVRRTRIDLWDARRQDAPAPFLRALADVRAVADEAPEPLGRALRLRLQRDVWERHVELIAVLQELLGSDRPWRDLTAAARDLAPGSPPALGLGAIADGAGLSEAGQEAWPTVQDAADEVARLDERWARVRGVYAGIWLRIIPLQAAAERWEEVARHSGELHRMARAAGLVDERGRLLPAAERHSTERAFVAGALERRAHMVLDRARRHEASFETAIAAAEACSEGDRGSMLARVHLARGRPDLAPPPLLQEVRDGPDDPARNLLLQLEAALQAREAGAARALAERAAADAKLGGLRGPTGRCLRALLAALERDGAAARALLAEQGGPPDPHIVSLSLPWRDAARTRDEVEEALRRPQ